MKNKKIFSLVILILFIFGGCNNTTQDELDNSNNTTDNISSPSNKYYTLFAWNDLGMHCMDKDYSVFAILPPYNTLVAQLIQKGKEPKKLKTDVFITYEAISSLDGKYNTTSQDKTNFWDYVKTLFGLKLDVDVGLANNKMVSKNPQHLTYNSKYRWWSADAIPITPKNDDGTYNNYPMVKLIAKDSSGNILATTTTVLPVSDEMDCKKCHSSLSKLDSAKPKDGWVNMSNEERDYRFNILRLHDDKYPNAVLEHNSSLIAKGWIYDNAGLEATVNNGTPILCASCHKSNAIANTGVDNIKPLTQVIHSKHATVKDPDSNLTLDNIENRNSCYSCHPGKTTQCLRGAMGSAKNKDGSSMMQCQSCHGNMSAVGSSSRDGWLDEPSCQNCHQNSKRYITAVTDVTKGTLREALDTRFATDNNKPIDGKKLYRYSTGHGGMQCSACHGSTHAIYPSIQPEDNIQSIKIQGHIGTIGECTSCHTYTPFTSRKGPHGMHSISQKWVDKHEDYAEDGKKSRCAVCHGMDYKGSELSKVMSNRSFSTKWGTKKFKAGDKIGCYDCHNGPDEDD